jgi:sorbitol-specific phosphotransferase system component IIBC
MNKQKVVGAFAIVTVPLLGPLLGASIVLADVTGAL